MTAFPSPNSDAWVTVHCVHGSSPHIQGIPGFNSFSSTTPSYLPPVSSTKTNNNKRKRRPAGTPDPDAEVVALSPEKLMELDRYVCEICNQGFQRNQNLQMHRRRHKVPWKLLKRPSPVVRKCVYVCPDPTCLHNDPSHALGDLVGIKKHFRRKHSSDKQWKCEKCFKEYAVQSDYKAHLKTCGSRGHSCDCGRVFSRVESFIQHQGNCNPIKGKPTFGYNNSKRVPSSSVTTDCTSDITASSTSSGILSAGRALDSRKFYEQAWLNIMRTELQFLPVKHHSDTSEAPQLTADNLVAAALIRDHILTHASKPSSHPASNLESRYNNTYTSPKEEEASEGSLRLQLSIGR